MTSQTEARTLDIQQIMQYLPHRYPFLLLDRVLNYEVGKTLHAIKNVTINEHFFQGHFPVKPVFPGVLILEAMAQATGVLGYLSYTDKPGSNTIYYFATIDNVRSVETFVVYKSFNLKVPLTNQPVLGHSEQPSDSI